MSPEITAVLAIVDRYASGQMQLQMKRGTKPVKMLTAEQAQREAQFFAECIGKDIRAEFGVPTE